MTGDALIVFLKAPRPGRVKTRLAEALGDGPAAELYRVLAEEEVRRTEPAGGEYERLFFFDPADAGEEMEAWFPGQAWIPQEGPDLGARMAAAFDETFARGARRAAVVGSDVPWVTRDHVGRALRCLDRHDLVLGPAHDGGYYLLALDRPRPALFDGIAWSTPAVLASTLERAAGLGLTVRLLEGLPDIDTLDDVAREWDRLLPILGGRSLTQALRRAVAARSGTG